MGSPRFERQAGPAVQERLLFAVLCARLRSFLVIALFILAACVAVALAIARLLLRGVFALVRLALLLEVAICERHDDARCDNDENAQEQAELRVAFRCASVSECGGRYGQYGNAGNCDGG